MTVFSGIKIIGQATGGDCFQLRTVIRSILGVGISAFNTKIKSDFTFHSLHGGRSSLFLTHRPKLAMAASALAVVFLAIFSIELQAQTKMTPAAYLASQPKPNFAPNHRLPHLSKLSWPFSYELRVEMASNWGYALEFLYYNPLIDIEKELKNSNSIPAKCLALSKSDPKKFPLSVCLDRIFPAPTPDGFYVTNSQGLFVDTSSNTWKYATNTQYKKVISPEGPDSYWMKTAEDWVAPLRIIQSNAPIAIIQNMGEYGLDVSGFGWKAWRNDPRVVSAMATNQISLNRYISNRKARQLSFLTEAVRKAVPNRELYVFYFTGNEQNRFYLPGYTKWQDEWANWGWASDVMNANTDLPSFESYYMAGNSWTNKTGAKWNEVTDLLTKHLNAVGFNSKLGSAFNYSWVCAGWTTNTGRLADIPRYMGFLKCLYTSGMVGAAAGFFNYPEGGFNASFPANNPPHWLLQIEALGHVHALFSHLDNYIYNGDLLAGPNPHFMSLDQPAYEFPTGDATVRVLSRKLRSGDRWLITAWAAAGEDRNVSVTIPGIGTKQLLARASGAVYQATKTNLVIVDINGILPSESVYSSPIKLRTTP